MNTTTKTMIAAILITLISGIAAAEIQENWPYGKTNIALDGIEHVVYDFEEGRNCGTFKNQHPDIATFLTVPASSRTPDGYGPDYPSYVRIGGSMCGTTRCVMYIYPHTNGGRDWIYITNGNASFAPVTCCEDGEVCWLGSCYPGINAKIEFKEDTTYISFLVSTGPSLYIRMYDQKGNWLYSETVGRTIDRVGSEPSNFTRFEIHLPDKEIGSMTLSGAFNGWHIDDLIVGGAPGYLPLKPVDYSDVAMLAEELHGVQYLEYGVGHDYLIMEYLDSWQFGDGIDEKYWNPETKTFELGEGISNAGLIVWAYNKVSKELYDESTIKHITVAKMEKHDFKIDVDPAATQPGDVCFMDRDFDGTADEVYMVTEEHDGGFDLITACPDSGVINSKSSIVEGSPAFMGYKRLPGVIRGGKNPIPKGH